MMSILSKSQSMGYEDLSLIFSRDDGNGSVRFVSMGGAYGALGGNVTAMTVNPAGISVFRQSNASVTFQSRSTNYLANYYGNSTATRQDVVKISNAGSVFYFEDVTSDEWSRFALGFNYRILADFNTIFSAKGNSGFASFNQYPLDNGEVPIRYEFAEEQNFLNDYRGELTELSFSLSGVLEGKVHLGAGLNFYNLTFSQQVILTEDNNDGNGNSLRARFYQENFTTGAGFSISAGVIYKPFDAFRFGLSYQSPSWFNEITENTNITNNDGFMGDTQIEVSTDDRGVYDNTVGFNLPAQGLLYRLRTPSKVTSSAAIVFGKFGLISFDYLTRNYRSLNLSGDDFSRENQFFATKLRKTNSINSGTEWRIGRLSIRAGYRYEQSPNADLSKSDDLQSYSFGFGYNFDSLRFNFGYTTSNRTGLYDFYPQYNQIEPTQLEIDTTRITIGFSFRL